MGGKHVHINMYCVLLGHDYYVFFIMHHRFLTFTYLLHICILLHLAVFCPMLIRHFVPTCPVHCSEAPAEAPGESQGEAPAEAPAAAPAEAPGEAPAAAPAEAPAEAA